MNTFQLKQNPLFKTDVEAENFVDITDYDLLSFKSVYFKFLPKESSINI
ncbi:hypothetical protein [Bartonella pachyuromydis]|uniref:Uncharacterized protein n=1 Tax=Bartonella pachyuromydis TaxID=931097 RepID=A0ABP8VPT2_9HYPH